MNNFLEKIFPENLRRPKKRCCVRKNNAQKQDFELLWGPYDPLEIPIYLGLMHLKLKNCKIHEMLILNLFYM